LKRLVRAADAERTAGHSPENGNSLEPGLDKSCQKIFVGFSVQVTCDGRSWKFQLVQGPGKVRYLRGEVEQAKEVAFIVDEEDRMVRGGAKQLGADHLLEEIVRQEPARGTQFDCVHAPPNIYQRIGLKLHRTNFPT